MTDTVSAPHDAHHRPRRRRPTPHEMCTPAGETQAHRPHGAAGYRCGSCSCLVFGLPLLFMIVSSFKPDIQIFADLTSIKAFLPVGDLSFDNYLRRLRPGAVRPVPDQLGHHLRRAPSALGLIVNSMAAFALARMQVPRPEGHPRRHPRHPDRAVRDAWRCRCCGGSTSCRSSTS